MVKRSACCNSDFSAGCMGNRTGWKNNLTNHALAMRGARASSLGKAHRIARSASGNRTLPEAGRDDGTGFAGTAERG